jgi:hypothetical protein
VTELSSMNMKSEKDKNTVLNLDTKYEVKAPSLTQQSAQCSNKVFYE